MLCFCGGSLEGATLNDKSDAESDIELLAVKVKNSQFRDNSNCLCSRESCCRGNWILGSGTCDECSRRFSCYLSGVTREDLLVVAFGHNDVVHATVHDVGNAKKRNEGAIMRGLMNVMFSKRYYRVSPTSQAHHPYLCLPSSFWTGLTSKDFEMCFAILKDCCRPFEKVWDSYQVVKSFDFYERVLWTLIFKLHDTYLAAKKKLDCNSHGIIYDFCGRDMARVVTESLEHTDFKSSLWDAPSWALHTPDLCCKIANRPLHASGCGYFLYNPTTWEEMCVSTINIIFSKNGGDLGPVVLGNDFAARIYPSEGTERRLVSESSYSDDMFALTWFMTSAFDNWRQTLQCSIEATTWDRLNVCCDTVTVMFTFILFCSPGVFRRTNTGKARLEHFRVYRF